MEAKWIKVIKDWQESKSIHNIQVFLGFANFYQQFIQGFNRIATSLTSMLKMIESPDKPTPSKNNGKKSASSRNNNSRSVFEKNNGNSEVNGFGVGRNGVKYIKKSRKLSKSRKSKSEIMFKSRNLAKLKKKLLKIENSINFDATKAGPKFLTPNARITFNRLWLAFIEALIL